MKRSGNKIIVIIFVTIGALVGACAVIVSQIAGADGREGSQSTGATESAYRLPEGVAENEPSDA